MPNSDDTNDAPMPGPEAILIGMVSGDYRDFVEHMTKGDYTIPGDLASIGIMPGIVEGGGAGLMLCFRFGAGNEEDRVEVCRVPYHALLSSLIAVTVAMHETGVLKDEPLGAQIESLMNYHRQEHAKAAATKVTH
jgi:hypothetical protein